MLFQAGVSKGMLGSKCKYINTNRNNQCKYITTIQYVEGNPFWENKH